MREFFDTAYDLLFLALGWGFALVAIVTSWASMDHGLRDVTLAVRSRDEKRDEVVALAQRDPDLRAEYLRVYGQIRKQGCALIEQGKGHFELYRQTVQKSAKYSDIDMVFPEISLPPELESAEPPPLPVAQTRQSQSRNQEGDE
jgi:hypothetical protein